MSERLIETVTRNGMEWERFPFLSAGRHPVGIRGPRVTLQSRIQITLNKAAYEALGEPKAIQFLFDREQRLMGFKEASPAEPYAAPVRPQQRKGKPPSNYIVSGLAFTNHYNIDRTGTPRYEAYMHEDTLVVDLKTKPEYVARPKKKR